MANVLKQLNKRRAKGFLAALIIVLSAYFGLNQDQTNQILGYLDESQPGFYQVIEVNDGDTITVNMNGVEERVRLIGVDTPEKNHPQKPVQCFAEAATEFTTNLIGDNDVRLEADPTNSNRDRYDRLLRYVYLPDDTLVNSKIIQEGYGFAYLSFPFQKSTEFEIYEIDAMQNEKGLWSSCEITNPSDFGPQTNDI